MPVSMPAYKSASIPAPLTNLITGLPPFIPAGAKVLILGSMPSVKSLAQGFYYAHPQNRMFKLISHYVELALQRGVLNKDDLSAAPPLYLQEWAKSFSSVPPSSAAPVSLTESSSPESSSLDASSLEASALVLSAATAPVSAVAPTTDVAYVTAVAPATAVVSTATAVSLQALSPVAASTLRLSLATVESRQLAARWLGIAFYDVIAACERTSSLDSNIRNYQYADIKTLLVQHPTITTVITNGGFARQHFKRSTLSDEDFVASRPFHYAALPSTSPANTIAYARLEELYDQELLPALGLS